MDKEQLDTWYLLLEQYRNGWHLSNQDRVELLRLNYLVMEASHEIHNHHMLMEVKNEFSQN